MQKMVSKHEVNEYVAEVVFCFLILLLLLLVLEVLVQVVVLFIDVVGATVC